MRQYNFPAYLNSISNLDYFEMIREASREATFVESALSPGRGRKGIDKQHEDEAIKYRSLLGAFVFFLRYGIKPTGITDEDFQSFRPVIEKLVGKGQLKSTILSLF